MVGAMTGLREWRERYRAARADGTLAEFIVAYLLEIERRFERRTADTVPVPASDRGDAG